MVTCMVSLTKLLQSSEQHFVMKVINDFCILFYSTFMVSYRVILANTGNWCHFLCPGFSEIMSSLTGLGFFNNEFHPMLSQDKGELPSKPTFNMFLQELLKCALQDRETHKDLKETQDCSTKQMDIVEMLIRVGCCKGSVSANKTASCIKYCFMLLYKFQVWIGSRLC